jgi:type II secretory pathway pseudopilin PulG
MGAALGGGLASGGLSAWGASKGADAMADAIEQAVRLQQEQMRLARQEFTPYAQAGRESLTQYQGNIGNQPSYQNVLANLVNDPGYQFRMQQGQQAIEGGAAARGNLLSGAHLKDLTEYSQGMASQEGANAYNREFNAFNNTQNQLANLMQQGFNASGQIVGTGQATTNNLANLAMQGGANQSNYYTNLANAGQGFLNGMTGAAMFNQMYPG